MSSPRRDPPSRTDAGKSHPHIWRSPYPWLAALAAVLVGAYVVLLANVRRTARQWPQPVRTATAVGDSACISCHRDKATFEQTAHRQTMRLPTRQTILGNFSSGSNVLHTDRPDMHFRMDADSTGFYQTLVVGKGADSTSRTERIAYSEAQGEKVRAFFTGPATSYSSCPCRTTRA